MKSIIYTQKIEDALLIAANLGGIRKDGDIIREKARKENENALIKFFSKEGFIQTTLPSKDEAVVIWGEKLITTMSLAECGNGESLHECVLPYTLPVKPTRGHAKELEQIVEVLSNKEYEGIIDASRTADGTRQLIMICNGHDIYKSIRRAKIDPFAPEGVYAAFENMTDEQESYRLVLKEKTKQLLYYLVNMNYPRFIPGYKKYLLSKDFPLVNALVQRQNQIEEYNAKNSFVVSLEAVTEDGEIFTLKSRKAVFSTKQAAEEFAGTVPNTMQVSITRTEEKTACQGPHSASSIEKVAKSEYGISPQETRIALSSLSSLGYVSNTSSSERKIPEFAEEEMLEIIRDNLAATAVFEEYIGKMEEYEIDPKVLSPDRKSGILPTRKIMTKRDSVDKNKRNIYYLVCKELVKTVLGPRITLIEKVELNVNGISFTASERKVLKKGHEILDNKPNTPSEIPESLKNGDTVSIRIAQSATTGSAPKPYTEGEIIQNYGSGYYTHDEIIRAIARLGDNGFIVHKGTALLPTKESNEIVSAIREFDGLIDAPIAWERNLNEIGNINGELTREEAENYSKELIKSVRKLLTEWMNSSENLADSISQVPCPVCQTLLLSNSTSLTCPNCGWKTERNLFGRVFDDAELFQLTKHRTTSMVKDFKTETPGAYARVYLTDDNKIKLTEESTLACPHCEEYLKANALCYYCENCGLIIKREYYSYKLTGKDISSLVNNRQTGIISDFMASDGTKFKGILYIDASDGDKIKCAKVKE